VALGAGHQLAPCGAIAGIFARADRNRGVWKGPANLDAVLGRVHVLQVDLHELASYTVHAPRFEPYKSSSLACTKDWFLDC